jgi:glycosyltransferase involved in cell wall biosynthesis
LTKISCVLPVYNGEKYLRESIGSVLNQTHKDWELIIVNDGSTDKTDQVVKRFQGPGNKITYIHNPHNMNLPNSLNIGFSYATGDYWTWTSHDNLYERDAFLRLSAILDTGFDVAWSPMRIIDENGKLTGDYYQHDISRLKYENVVGASFMFRPAVFRALRGYNGDLFRAEDWDFWIRAYKKGFSFGFDPHYLYLYRRHPGMLCSQWWKCQVAYAKVARNHYGNIRAGKQLGSAAIEKAKTW